jgi:predicted nucleic acid-binding protein
MSIVVDASVTLKWVLNEPGTQAALALFGHELIAPELWLTEAANALWRHVRLGEASAAEALARIDELANAPVASVSTEPFVRRSLEIALEIRHPVYDCLYLAVAEDRNTYVITDDRRLFMAASAAGFADRIRLLGT